MSVHTLDFPDRSVQCLTAVTAVLSVRVLPDFAKEVCPMSVCPDGQGQKVLSGFPVTLSRDVLFHTMMSRCHVTNQRFQA